MSRRDAEGRRSTKVLRRRRSKCKAVSILSCRRATVRPSVRRSVPPRGGGGGPHGTSPGPGRSPLVGSPACRRPSGVGRRRREDTYVEATVPGPDEHFARLSVCPLPNTIRYEVRSTAQSTARIQQLHTHTHTPV